MSYEKVSYVRVCEYCGKQYVAHRKDSKHCSKKCKDITLRLRKGIKCNPNTEPFHKECAVCGNAFNTFREVQVTCLSDCAKKYHQRFRGRKPPKEPKACDVCGIVFIPRWDSQATCGNEQCKREHKKAYNAKVNLEKSKNKKIVNYILTECKFCGDVFYADERVGQKYCSKECARRASNKRHDKRIPKERRVDTITLQRLFKRDGGKCYLCGCDCDFTAWRFSENGNKYPDDRYPTIDHVKPIAAGGLDSWDNVRLACWKCNTKKSDKIVSVDPIGKEFAYSVSAKKAAKRTAQYTLDGQLVRIWESTAQIRRETGLNDSHIQNVCRRYGSNTGNAYGYHWEYIDEQPKRKNEQRQTCSTKSAARDSCRSNRPNAGSEGLGFSVKAIPRNSGRD